MQCHGMIVDGKITDGITISFLHSVTETYPAELLPGGITAGGIKPGRITTGGT